MEDEFKTWLEANHYRQTTIKDTIRAIDRVASTFETTGNVPEDANAKTAISRWLSFKKAKGETRSALYAACVEAGSAALAPNKLPKEKPARRKLEAKSFGDEDWERLRSVVQGTDEPKEQVLWAMATSGQRVGDVLRVDMASLRQGIETGELQLERKGGTFVSLPLGVPEPWHALYEGMRARHPNPHNVAEYVAPGYPNPEADGAAYKRIARKFKALGRKHQLPGRVHLHRLRRTFAVKALDATGDVVAVKEALAQKSLGSTMRYVDESRSQKVKSLQQQLAGTRK